MARVSPKSQHFRSKGIICRDLALVLQSGDLHFGTKLAVVNNALWVWSEFDGKYKGCRYWSVAALTAGYSPRSLIHEHLIPRKLIRAKLLRLVNPCTEVIFDILNQWCIGVVITKEEDRLLNQLRLGSSMPEGWDERDVWARYRAAGIRLVEKPI